MSTMFRRRKNPQSPAIITRASNHEGRLIRKAGPLTVIPHLFHDLGIQSNIVISADYSHPSAIVDSALVKQALRILISQHPALSIIGVSRPSTKTSGHHRLWEAHLPIIRLQDCVQFLDLDFDGDGQLAQTIEDIHNTWFETGDKTKPWWKVIIMNGKTVIFVAHHSIADGLSGFAFHRSFLEALNSSTDTKMAEDEESQRVETPRIDPSALPSPLDDFEEKLSWVYAIRNFLFWILLRFFISSKHFLFSDAVVSPRYPTLKHPFPASEKTITKVSILRINRKTMQKCLAACRQHQTSFTALLHTIIQVTLVVDEYPRAKLGFSRQAVSLRNLLRKDKRIGKDVITDAVSVFYRIDILSTYRKGLSQPNYPPNSEYPEQSESEATLNKETIWKLAKRYKGDLDTAMHITKSVAQNFLVAKALGEDDEDMGEFFGLGLYQNNSFLISNLGAFEPKDGHTGESEIGANVDEKWKVSDVAFSAGAIRAKLGDFGIVFNVASVKDGDCVICGCWEEGVLREEMVKRVFRRLGERIAILVG